MATVEQYLRDHGLEGSISTSGLIEKAPAPGEADGAGNSRAEIRLIIEGDPIGLPRSPWRRRLSLRLPTDYYPSGAPQDARTACRRGGVTHLPKSALK